MMQTLQHTLEQGLQALSLNVQPSLLLNYLSLLEKWNHAYNLTAVRNPQDMLSKHILDSLAIARFVQGDSVLDVGTGAGLPGIPLAIANPQLQVVLLDSNGKKTRFLYEVKRVLQLSNVEIVHSRVEAYQPTQGFDTVVSRAFSDINQMLYWTKHLIKHPGIWLAMKGRSPELELSTITHPFTIENYPVPGLDAERCCVIIKNI